MRAEAADEARPPALDVADVRAGYVGADVLHGLSISVASGEVTAVVGPNGAGKTTLLRTIAGFLPVRAGRLWMAGTDIRSLDPAARARLGLCDVPEGRGIFRSLTVRENIRLFSPRTEQRRAVARVAEEVPRLKRLLDRTAGTLSGGEQQLLALSRAYVSSPAVVLIDEVSLGLAPIVVDEVFAVLADLRARGAAMVLVEQYVQRAMALADSVCVLNRGRLAFAGTVDEAREVDLHSHYFQSAGEIDDALARADEGD